MAKDKDLHGNYFPHFIIFYSIACNIFQKSENQVAGYYYNKGTAHFLPKKTPLHLPSRKVELSRHSKMIYNTGHFSRFRNL